MEIKITEETKVVSRTMEIGDISDWYQLREIVNEVDGIKRKLSYDYGELSCLHYTPKISNKLLGWGCHVVSPAKFKKAYKNLKNGIKVREAGEGECTIKVDPLVKVIRIGSIDNRSVNKTKLLEAMEILIKAHKFLYGKYTTKS